MNWRIGAVFVAALVGLQLFAVAATQLSSYLTTERVLMGHAQQIMRDVADDTIAHVRHFLAPASAAADLTERLAKNDIVRSDSVAELERYLFEQLTSAPQVSGIYYGTITGEFYFVTMDASVENARYMTKLITYDAGSRKVEKIWRDPDFAEIRRTIDTEDPYDPRVRPWYMKALATGRLNWTDPYIFFTSGNPGITVSSPVVAPDGMVRGVVGADIEIQELSSFLAGLKIGQHGRAFIMSRDGDVIAFPDGDKIKQNDPAGEDGPRFTQIDELDAPTSRAAFAALGSNSALNDLETERFASFEADGEPHHAIFVPLPSDDWPWVVAIHIPENDYLGSIKDNQRDNALLAGAIALLTCLVGYAIARSLGKPLARLQAKAESITAGDLSRSSAVESAFSEIQSVATAFESLFAWLRKRDQDNSDLTAELRDANEQLEQRVADRTTALRTEIEEHRETSAALRRARDAANAANQAKSAFLSNMSHELRTPLNAIIGFSELLLDGEEGSFDEASSRQFIETIHSSGRHLLSLINDILDLSKVEAGHMELMLDECDVPSLVEQTLSTVQPLAARSSITLESDVEAAPGFVADTGKLKQILYNLLSNAIKFTPNDGTVTVTVRRRDDGLQLTVADTGIGISEENQERIFQEFQQIDIGPDRHFEGTGLGLTLSRRFAELHGGSIWVESTLGEGSEFHVFLPARLAPAEQGDGSLDLERSFDELSSSPLNLEGPDVLVVEDDLRAANLLSHYLRRGGYVPHVESNGDRVLERARRLQPAAITLDVLLPTQDGWEVLRALKRDPDTRDIPVIIASVVDNRDLGFALGATDYFVKPVDREALIARLDRLALSSEARWREVSVLIVDDEPDAVELLARMLEQQSFAVVRAYSGDEGIEKAIEANPDLILLDLMMPDVSGFDVVDRLRAQPATSDTPIIIVTAKELTAEDKARLNGHVTALLQKGAFAAVDLVSWLNKILAQSRHDGEVGVNGERGPASDHPRRRRSADQYAARTDDAAARRTSSD